VLHLSLSLSLSLDRSLAVPSNCIHPPSKAKRGNSHERALFSFSFQQLSATCPKSKPLWSDKREKSKNVFKNYLFIIIIIIIIIENHT